MSAAASSICEPKAVDVMVIGAGFADPDVRADPRASPLRARDLSNLPPALIVTCEFDPLRDQGAAYARGLSAAGVPTRHLDCRGQIHNSLMSVDVILSAVAARGEVAQALRGFHG